MNKTTFRIGIILLALGVLALSAKAVVVQQSNPTVTVGLFDSRAIAVAYIRSDLFHEQLRALQAELAQAEEAGDRDLTAELKSRGPKLQERNHRQAFGTAPVDDIIAQIEDELPALARTTGVQLIASKWAIAYKSDSANFIDLTSEMVQLFGPDESTLKVIEELLKQEPVTLEQLGEH